MIEVFVSVPGLLDDKQQALFERWRNRLSRQQFSLNRLGTFEIKPHTDHLAAMRASMQRCNGVVVFGFRQLRIDAGVWRPSTSDETAASTWWSTPWMQIETGMAIMAQKPILVLHEMGVTEGIFDRRNWGDRTFGARMDTCGAVDALRRWQSTMLSEQEATLSSGDVGASQVAGLWLA